MFFYQIHPCLLIAKGKHQIGKESIGILKSLTSTKSKHTYENPGAIRKLLEDLDKRYFSSLFTFEDTNASKIRQINTASLNKCPISSLSQVIQIVKQTPNTCYVD
jgi:hypothetical protein